MHPVLIQLGPLKIYSYGVFLGFSCVLGAHLAVYLAQRSGIAAARAWWFTITVIVVGILGGRVHDVIVNQRGLSELFALVHAGRTAYGAFLSATIAAVVASRVLQVGFWRFADAAAPTMALGLSLTRIGCFLAGCDYGVRSDRYGIPFPPGSPAWDDQLAAGEINLSATETLPVLPVQLLECLLAAAIFAGLMALWFRRPRREGDVLLGFFGLYGLVRAGIEQLRGDSGRGELLGLSTSTTIGLLTALGAALLAFLPQLRRLRPEAGPVLDVPPPEPRPAGEAKRT